MTPWMTPSMIFSIGESHSLTAHETVLNEVEQGLKDTLKQLEFARLNEIARQLDATQFALRSAESAALAALKAARTSDDPVRHWIKVLDRLATMPECSDMPRWKYQQYREHISTLPGKQAYINLRNDTSSKWMLLIQAVLSVGLCRIPVPVVNELLTHWQRELDTTVDVIKTVQDNHQNLEPVLQRLKQILSTACKIQTTACLYTLNPNKWREDFKDVTDVLMPKPGEYEPSFNGEYTLPGLLEPVDFFDYIDKELTKQTEEVQQMVDRLQYSKLVKEGSKEDALAIKHAVACLIDSLKCAIQAVQKAKPAADFISIEDGLCPKELLLRIIDWLDSEERKNFCQSCKRLPKLLHGAQDKYEPGHTGFGIWAPLVLSCIDFRRGTHYKYERATDESDRHTFCQVYSAKASVVKMLVLPFFDAVVSGLRNSWLHTPEQVDLFGFATPYYEADGSSVTRVLLVCNNGAFIALDDKCIIKAWNTAAEEMTGYTAELVCNTNLSQYYAEGDKLISMQDVVRTAIDTGEYKTFETSLWYRAGRVKYEFDEDMKTRLNEMHQAGVDARGVRTKVPLWDHVSRPHFHLPPEVPFQSAEDSPVNTYLRTQLILSQHNYFHFSREDSWTCMHGQDLVPLSDFDEVIVDIESSPQQLVVFADTIDCIQKELNKKALQYTVAMKDARHLHMYHDRRPLAVEVDVSLSSVDDITYLLQAPLTQGQRVYVDGSESEYADGSESEYVDGSEMYSDTLREMHGKTGNLGKKSDLIWERWTVIFDKEKEDDKHYQARLIRSDHLRPVLPAHSIPEVSLRNPSVML